MFTGIVEAKCRIYSINRSSGSLQLAVDLSPLEGRFHIGESVSINGVCLTVDAINSGVAIFYAVEETLSKSNLSLLKAGDFVNAERALRLGDRLGGHFVSGHVDGPGTLAKIEKLKSSVALTVECDPELTDNMIEKGSVAIEGVSLTITSISRGRFSVAVIPHTLEVTTLGGKKTGAQLNIEVDMLGKWVRKLLGKNLKNQSNISMNFLAEHGFQ